MCTRILACSVTLIAVLSLTIPGCARDEPSPPPAPPDPVHGQALFTSVCAQCHGLTAQGVKGLGANLRTSAFVRDNSDAVVLDLVKTGKPPTLDRPAMPPKGGRFDLTDQDLLDIIAYVRTLAENPD